MANHIKKGDSILIPFKNGQSIYDSQNRPRMYKTQKAFERAFPKHLIDIVGVELAEYVEVVRCKDCKEYIPWNDGRICARIGSYFGNTKPNDFCSRGERKMDAEVE